MTAATTRKLVKGDLVLSSVHNQYVRFVRYEHDGMIVVADRNTMRELPDLVHPSQVK